MAELQRPSPRGPTWSGIIALAMTLVVATGVAAWVWVAPWVEDVNELEERVAFLEQNRLMAEAEIIRLIEWTACHERGHGFNPPVFREC